MKSIKIFLVILLPALALISCEKSDIKPQMCETEATINEPVSEAPAVNSRVRSVPSSVDQGFTGDIVGGGDDDRDGGDKKKAGK